MTQQTRATNKAKFETGDAPVEADYVDLIDSFLSLADTSAQTVTSPVTFSDAVAIGGELSAASVSANSISITTNVSASGARFVTTRTGSLTVSGVASADTAVIEDATISALTVTIVSASTAVVNEANVSALTVVAIASIATAHMGAIVINTTATSTVSAPASANRYIMVTVSGANYWMPLFADG